MGLKHSVTCAIKFNYMSFDTYKTKKNPLYSSYVNTCMMSLDGIL